MSRAPIETYDKDLLQEMYRVMKLIREIESTFAALVDQGEAPGDAHLCTGQEATAVGACLPLREDDIIGGTHRSHGHVIAKGVDVNELMAEFGGKQTGLCGGRGGEMHLFDPANGVLETTGIVGANPPHVAGAVLAAQLDGNGQVGAALFGDGASNQGVVHETMNMAAIWELPMIFLCENNQYAVSTPRDYAVAGETISDRADGFGIPNETIDGQDILTVYETVSNAVETARNGGGPQFIECETYRFSGHYSAEERLMGDRPYRSDEEIREWRVNHDPIDSFASKLTEAGVLNEGEIASIDERIQATIDEAVEFMKESSVPPGERALENIYANQDFQNFPLPSYR